MIIRDIGRRFPAPWSAEVTPNCFIVRDADGQQLAYVYYESERGRRSAAKLLTHCEISTYVIRPLTRVVDGAWPATDEVAPVCDHSVAWGDSICGRRRRRDAALAWSMIAI